jgi:hypothetical protein
MEVEEEAAELRRSKGFVLKGPAPLPVRQLTACKKLPQKLGVLRRLF